MPPKVLVLLAAYNGAKWIRQQLYSVLGQEEVEVHVAIRDDGSSDATVQEIRHFANDSRVTLELAVERADSAAQNFLTLVAKHSADGFDYVAFADQDDIWDRDKLARGCRALEDRSSVGYSSATIARWPDGRSAVLRQADTITDSDFLFEGAGQGCTFVLNADFYARVRHFVTSHGHLMQEVHYHDWMIYALARSWGNTWNFDASPSMLYRQHEGNDTGARSTFNGLRKRLTLIRSGWYRRQIAVIATVCGSAAPGVASVEEWTSLLHANESWQRRMRIALFCIRGGRRKRLDNIMVIVAALAGWL